MFNLTTGSYRALEQKFVEDVLTQKKDDPLASVLVISPSGHLLNHLQRQLSKGTSEHESKRNSSSLAPLLPLSLAPSFLNIHFLTFYALAERILSEGPAPEDRIVSEPALYREIIYDFLEGKGDVPFLSRGFFRRTGPIPKGLTGALSSTLKDLQDSGAKVVDMATVAREGHLGEATDNAVPILELNLLMYDVLRKRGLRSGADFIRRAAEAAPQSAWLKQQKAIYLYGFYDLTGVQLDLINALASHTQAHVYFPYEKDNPAFGYAENLLKDPAFATKCKNKKTSEQESKRNTNTHDLLLPCSLPPSIDVWSCSGTHDEIWLAAKKILEQARAGVPYHKMALIARTLEPYLNNVREVLEAHSIPYALHSEEPVGAYPLIKMARQALTRDTTTGEGKWSEHVSWAINLLKMQIKLPRDASPTELRLWDGLIDTIEGLSQLDALDRDVSRERFLDVLEEKLSGLRLPLTSDNTAGVQVMDVMTARGLPFDAVFLVGLNEKLFPRLIREDPFLSDSARSSLAQALGARLGRKMDGYQEEKLLFALAVSSAEKVLHLSCQRSDEEGKALVISLYLHDFLRTQKLELKALRRAWMEKIRQVPLETLRPKEISLAFQRENRDTDTLYAALGWDRDLMNHLLHAQDAMESFKALGDYDGLIGKDHPLTKTLLSEGLSPATLKDLAECPFKVYGRKVLELRPGEPDVEDGEVAHTARGKLIHEILEEFYRRHSGESRPSTHPAGRVASSVETRNPGTWEPLLDRVSGETFLRFAKDHSDLYPVAWQAEQNRILTVLKRFIPLDLAEMKESGFKPAHFEVEMETKEPTSLHGRVDRLDLKPGAFRVVDYKTGSGGIGKKETIDTAILKGKNFQLPVYLLMAKAWLEKQSVDTSKMSGEAAFYQLKEEDPMKHRLDAEFWDEHGDRFYQNLSLLIKNIESGSFYIRPSDSHGYCRWCQLSAICRKEHKPTQSRSLNSPQRKKHEEAFNSKGHP